MIWATDFEEEIVKTTESAGGGKGGSGGDATIRQYRYYANFAVALGEGVVTRIGRIWADEQEIDLSRITFRLHTGTETDSVDSLIAAREGADNAPAIAASPTSCSSGCRSPITAIAFRNCRSRSSAASRTPAGMSAASC